MTERRELHLPGEDDLPTRLSSFQLTVRVAVAVKVAPQEGSCPSKEAFDDDKRNGVCRSTRRTGGFAVGHGGHWVGALRELVGLMLVTSRSSPA